MMRIINKERKYRDVFISELMLKDFSCFFNADGVGKAFYFDVKDKAFKTYEQSFNKIKKVKYKDIEKSWLVFEVNANGVESIANDSNLPEPSLIVKEVWQDGKSVKANLFYKLSEAIGSRSSRENIKNRVDIENAFTEAIGANKSFKKKEIRNPFYLEYQALVSDIEPYDLDELAEYVVNEVSTESIKYPSLLASNKDIFDNLVEFVRDDEDGYLAEMDKEELTIILEEEAVGVNYLLKSVFEIGELKMIVKAVVEHELEIKPSVEAVTEASHLSVVTIKAVDYRSVKKVLGVFIKIN